MFVFHNVASKDLMIYNFLCEELHRHGRVKKEFFFAQMHPLQRQIQLEQISLR